ncbi:sensor histidine kinase [Microbacterium oleivorans]|uniref:histidine kinase n=1 Tax=Microbacterium oleivorans TaxID=273677 RepID=A0A7D5F7X7_9MICO|nr:histidine kinase [Microbacterium oleivorans]QLD11229.1 hypothetical protein HW566_05230 [Microbacterium oleivorans]
MAERVLLPARHARGAHPSAPPLTGIERWAVLAIVVVAVITSTVLAITRGGENAWQAAFEVVVTALFAGFLVSPAVTIIAFATSMGLSLLIGSSTEMLLALAVATGLAARTAGTRLLAAYVGLLLVSVAAAVFSAASDQLSIIVICLLLATVSGATGLLLRFARNREQRLREQLTRQTIIEQEVRQSERLLIADELHDVVSRDLTIIVMQAELMSLDAEPGSVHESQATIRDAARRALRDLHRLVARVQDERADTSATEPLRTALRSAAQDLERAGFPLSASVSDRAFELPQIIDTTVARMVRESVTNILKHAGPGPVSISVDIVDGTVRLSVRSRLGRRRPLTPLPSSAYGSIRMRERAILLGGGFDSQREGREWVVTAGLPIA